MGLSAAGPVCDPDSWLIRSDVRCARMYSRSSANARLQISLKTSFGSAFGFSAATVAPGFSGPAQPVVSAPQPIRKRPMATRRLASDRSHARTVYIAFRFTAVLLLMDRQGIQ